ncbi:unnamed protein product, partial [Ascophyllum nodosum]
MHELLHAHLHLLVAVSDQVKKRKVGRDTAQRVTRNTRHVYFAYR